MRIITKLTLAFLISALLVLIVGYYSANKSQEILEETIGYNSVMLAQETIDKIDRDIYNRIEELQVYSKDMILQKSIKESNEEFEKLDDIQNYINEKDKKWTSLPKEGNTAFMKRLINNELAKELRRKQRFYKEKYNYDIFAEVFVTNKYGANVAQTGRTSDYYQADEKWWQNAKKDGLYVADIGYDKSADIYSIDICTRIDDESGNFLGVMKAVLNIKEVTHIIDELNPSRTREYKSKQMGHGYEEHETMGFKLINKEGKLIYSTEKAGFDIFENVSDALLSHIDEKRGKAYFIVQGEKTGEGERLFAYAHSEGYRDFKGLGLSMLIEHETKEIFAPVAKLRNTLLVISFIVAMIAVLLGLFMSRSIYNPITKLEYATIEIGKGRLDTDIEIQSNDEIGQLGLSFRKMVEDLKKTTMSRDYVANIVNSAYGSLMVVSPDGKIRMVNRGTLNLLGYNENELLNQSINKILEEDDLLFKVNVHEELLQRGFIDNVEVNYISKSGRKMPMLLSVSVMGTAAGEIQGIVCSAVDIAKRKYTEEERKKFAVIEERATIIDAMGDGLILVDMDGRIISINPAFENITGYDKNKLIYMQGEDFIRKLVKQHDINKGLKMLNTVIKGRYSAPEVIILIRKNGQEVPVAFTAAFIKDMRGKATTIILTVKDITELKNAEEERSRATVAVIDSMNDGVVVITVEGIITSVNPAFEKMTGYNKVEFVGLDSYKVMPQLVEPEDVEKTMGTLSTALAGKVSEPEALTFKTKDGRELPVTFSASLINDKNGTPIYIIWMFRDIIVLRSAENERLRATAKILNCKDHAAMLLAMDGNIISVNTAFETKTGYSSDELSLTDCDAFILRFVKQENVEKASAVLETSLMKNISDPADITILAKDGREIQVTMEASFIKDIHDSPMNIMLTLKDVS